MPIHTTTVATPTSKRGVTILTQLTISLNLDRVRSLTFKTIKEAEEFYISYGREVGFDVRKSSLKRKRNSGLVLSRVWLCAREGFLSERIKNYDRKREAKVETRCGCKASFRVAIDNSMGEYKVTRFEPQHNHPLETSDTSHHLRCNSQRLKRIEGGDVNTLLGLLEGMKMKDESLRFKYTVDGNGAFTRLSWCDGMSRAEYEQFGDVVLFDSTYKTNMYRFPIVLFSGVNCHLCTCIFGIAILYSETIESYRWLLQTFRESMNGKSPIAVLTDQNASMRAAVLS
ncbi:hypothetical protein RD792_003481 [Penstemon davidsonii]|uniref:Protein FAR1-RELATED SEQUENCE n=1 Tax=Penstemon davidsonii TaxID=160366 RepID=A0ABR0DTU9_9LAMI|nr:hypothetical protein RD792_003481 [Penstemon davidsonii]